MNKLQPPAHITNILYPGSEGLHTEREYSRGICIKEIYSKLFNEEAGRKKMYDTLYI